MRFSRPTRKYSKQEKKAPFFKFVAANTKDRDAMSAHVFWESPGIIAANIEIALILTLQNQPNDLHQILFPFLFDKIKGN